MLTFGDVLGSFCPVVNRPGAFPAGLFVSGSEKSVPLRIRTVNSTVHCDTSFADTTETFAFIADEDVSVVFKFPLPTRSAVYKLEATVGDKTIVTEVKPKQEAQAEFTQAVNQGNTAVIAKQEDASQIFTFELGNLEAMQEAIVTLSYLRMLDSVGGALEWVHTATWTPPYLGSAGDQARGPQAALDQNPRFATKVAYSLAYDIKLLSSRGFKAVESPEPVTVADVAEGPLSCKHVTLSEQISDPSKDLTLLVELQPLDAAHYAASTANGYGQVSTQRTARPGPAGSPPRTKTFALATFVPRPLLTTTDSSTSAPLHLELILIVDCSGSMYGQRIDQARDAAIYFIKDLPANRGIRFNIVLFGSNHVLWQPSCQDFNQATMTSAVEWVRERCHANMGGTEMVATFQAVYAMPATEGYTRQIIFLTDGGISSMEEQAMVNIVTTGRPSLPFPSVSPELQQGIDKLKAKVLGRQAVSSPSAHTLPTVHCLGIGHGVHRGLLDSLASRTGGVSQYVVDGESITRKAAFLSKTCLAGPSVVCAPRLSATAGVVRAVPHVLPPCLFPDQAVHMLVEVDSDQPPATLRLEGKRGDGSPWALELPVDVKTSTEGEAYHVLHTMCYVAGLLDGSSHLHTTPDGTPLPTQPAADDVKASVVAAAISAHLVTRHTAAVGVLIQKDPLDPSKVSKVEVPLVTPHGADLWKGPSHSLTGSGPGPIPWQQTPTSFVAANFGAGPQSACFGAGPQSACFGAGPQSACFGAGPQSACFGAGPQSASFGAGPQSASFGAGPQSASFGAGPQSASLFGATAPKPAGARNSGFAAADWTLKPAATDLFGAAPATTTLFGAAPAPAPGTVAPPALFGATPALPTPAGTSFSAATAQPSSFAFGSVSEAGTVPFGSSAGMFGTGSGRAFGANTIVSGGNTAAFGGSASAVGIQGGVVGDSTTTLLGGVIPSFAWPPATLSPGTVPTLGGEAMFSTAPASHQESAGLAALTGVSVPVAMEDATPMAVDDPWELVGEDEAVEKAHVAVAPAMPAGVGSVQPACPTTAPPAGAAPALTPSEVLSELNLLRGLEGQWAASEEVLQLVVSQVAGSRAEAVQAARAGKPAALTEEQWVTVLALAFLRKHCVSERSVWESMESKAMGWLSGAWPQGCKTVGLTVLGAMKLV